MIQNCIPKNLEACNACFDNMPMAFTIIQVLVDENGQPVDFVFRYANKALADLEGVNLEALLGRSFYAEIFPETNDRYWLRPYYAAAYEGKTDELHQFSVEIGKYLKIICYPWNDEGCCACILEDETELVNANKQLEYMANYDISTKVGNKNRYMEFCVNFCGENTGVLFVDVNELKITNDKYGHRAGDFLIKLAVDKVTATAASYTYAPFRIGGDEFVFVFCSVEKDKFQKLATDVYEAMHNDDIGHMPSILAAVGSSWSEQCTNLRKLVKQADADMYLVKRRDRNFS